jgi:hypothetical protein
VLSAKKSNFVLHSGPQRRRVLNVEYLGEFDSSFETAEVMEPEAWWVLLKKKKTGIKKLTLLSLYSIWKSAKGLR